MIESGLDGGWPAAAVEASDAFQQGHLIAEPPLFYAASLDHPVWGLSRLLAGEIDDPEERAETLADLQERPPYGLITTQTCDLAEEGKTPSQPWVQVAPVYEVEVGDRLLDRRYIMELEPPSLRGVWVVDLRIEMPLEKGLLVGRTPIESFADELGYVRLGQHLAWRRGRPALAPIFNEILDGSVRVVKRSSGARRNQTRRVRERVVKLMIAVTDGTRLAPEAAQLHVVLQGAPTEEDKDWFGAWFDEARPKAEDAGLTLLPVRWHDARAISLSVYDDLIEVDNPMWR